VRARTKLHLIHVIQSGTIRLAFCQLTLVGNLGRNSQGTTMPRFPGARAVVS